MPNIFRGRLDGMYGMMQFTALELHAMADEYLRMISDPDCPDDSRWLSRREKELRTLAIKKENQSSIKIGSRIF